LSTLQILEAVAKEKEKAKGKGKSKEARSDESRPRDGENRENAGKENVEASSSGRRKEGMPAYEEWSLVDLQKEVQKYGYKPAGSKSVIVGQLTSVWEALQRARKAAAGKSAAPCRKTKSTSKESGVSMSTTGATKKKGKAATATVPTTTTAMEKSKPKKKGASKGFGGYRNSASSSSSSLAASDVGVDSYDEDEGEDEVDLSDEEVNSAWVQLREAILKDEKLYLRILRYEVRSTPLIPPFFVP
jgi:hypothetical protein